MPQAVEQHNIHLQLLLYRFESGCAQLGGNISHGKKSASINYKHTALYRQTGRKAGRQTDIQTHTNTHMHAYLHTFKHYNSYLHEQQQLLAGTNPFSDRERVPAFAEHWEVELCVCAVSAAAHDSGRNSPDMWRVMSTLEHQPFHCLQLSCTRISPSCHTSICSRFHIDLKLRLVLSFGSKSRTLC